MEYKYDPEYDFCVDCKYFGEPNGCNRPGGTCDNYDKFNEMYDRLNELEKDVEQVKKEAVKEFVTNLKDAYPEGNRDSHIPMIDWNGFCYIVDETLEEYLDE